MSIAYKPRVGVPIAGQDALLLGCDPRAVWSIPVTGPLSLGPNLDAAPAAAAWPNANDAFYVPFRVPVPVKAVSLITGSGTTGTGNLDGGIYDAAGNLLTSSGSTARTVSVENILNFTDVVLQPGLYYMALSHDSTQNIIRFPMGTNIQFVRAMGVMKQASAFPLPSTATFATATAAYVPSMMVLLDRTYAPSYGRPCFPPARVITPWHPESLGNLMLSGTRFTTATSAAPGANVVTYCPFSLYEFATVVKMTLLVGATNTGNVQIGVYDHRGNRLITSGTVALGTANTLQEFDVTDTLLAPGAYYMAVTLSDGAGTVFRTSETDEIGLSRVAYYTETTGGFGLPTTPTFALSTATTVSMPVMGVNFETLV